MARHRTTEGGGPWVLSLDTALQPGSTRHWDLRRMEYRGRKGYFRDWLPMDNCLIKNLDDANSVRVTYNDQFEAVVEPNAADSFEETGITRVAVENQGGTEIPAANLVVQVSSAPYGADEAARERRERHPVENMIRGALNL